MTAPDLKPCPFCGGTDLEIREMGEEWHVVSCNGCNAEGGYYLPDDSTMPEEAAELWNRRHTPLAEALAWIKKHGVHADDCETVTRQDEPQFSFYEMQDYLDAVSAICTCGLTAILRAIGEGRADG